ncbi:hypothetical protein ES706_06041 [subsurface metagenome]
MSGRVIQEFAPEALAKAKELQVPGSLATRAALGITLYLYGHHEPRVISMIRGAMKFCELYERDLSATSAEPERKLQNFPQFYRPSEIFQAPSMSEFKEANMAEKLSNLKKTLSLIGTQEEHLLKKEKLAECRDLLAALATPYVANAMSSMGEYKRSRKGSTW